MTFKLLIYKITGSIFHLTFGNKTIPYIVSKKNKPLQILDLQGF